MVAYPEAISGQADAGDLVLRPTGVATGGDALARDGGGRVVLIVGALPGETVRAGVTETHRNWARAATLEVLEASPDRVAPPCPHVAEGCGGCGWQHVRPEAQGRLKAMVVADNLARLGHIKGAVVRWGGGVGPFGYRTALRMVVSDGKAGFRRRHTHTPVGADECMVAHPLLVPLIREARFGTAREVTLRCGARTGERMAVVAPTAEGCALPGDVMVVGEDAVAAGEPPWLHEEVSGQRLRVSAGSFFQSSPEGAELLVGAVSEAVEGAPDGVMVDAYGGVGLFGLTLGQASGRPIIVLETSASSLCDARANLPGARAAATDVGRWRPEPAAVVVADPPRAGLGAKAAAVLAGTGASHLALVSCDPASLGRDAGLLASHGFELEWSKVVDLFPGTPHVETVSRFVR